MARFPIRTHGTDSARSNRTAQRRPAMRHTSAARMAAQPAQPRSGSPRPNHPASSAGGTPPVPTRQAPARYTQRRSKRVRRRLVVTALVLCIAGAGAFAASGAFAPIRRAAAEATQTPEAPESTPRSEWRQGETPYLYQTDAQWAGEPYAGGTIGENACGPTCLSMVYVRLTGKTDKDPAAMARYSEENGHVADGMTAWTLMGEGARGLGLSSREVAADAGIVRATLRQGMPIVASVRPGDFTTTGHFIVLTGVDENGDLEIRDPNSPERSHRTWDVDRVLGQCSNLWAFSA